MIVAGSASPLLLSSAGGYNLTKSLRFRASATAYLNRTPASASNRTTWTWSGWVKRGFAGGPNNWAVFFAESGGNTNARLEYLASGQFRWFYQVSGVDTALTVSNALYRDYSAWYHVVFVYDSTQATGANRQILYVNGVQTTNSSVITPAQNTVTSINNTVTHWIGRNNTPEYFDGYLAEVNFIDGQALTPSSFGQTSTSTGVWIPKKYTGTYGTNGFYLPFTDVATTSGSNAGLGKDFSGNGNYWTTNNISVTSGTTYDSMSDVPTLTSATTANYCTWNPLDKGTVTVTNGNLSAVSAADAHAIRATMGLPLSGKFYWETTVSGLGYGSSLGIASATSILTTGASSPETRTYQWGSWFNTFNSGIVQYGTNQTLTGGTNWSGASQLATNDVLMIAVDMDNGSMWVGKNGTWFNSSGTANPATNTDPRWTGLGGTTWFAYYSGYGSVSPVTANINFGQQPFAYTPPTGFKALNTFNLPTPTIGATASTTANKYFDISLWTGTGVAQNITNSGSMQPDWVWTKTRSQINDHFLFDAIRGVNNYLRTNSTGAEATVAGNLTAFNSDGFSVGTNNDVNGSGRTFVGWQWRGANGTVSNTAGSITSTVSANTTAGFSIATYTGNGSTGATIGHGLGVTPSMVIVKKRSSTGNWITYHTSTGINQYLYLNSTASAATASPTWGVSSTTVTFQQAFSDYNDSGVTYVAYCFAQVAGYSAFGSYVGNSFSAGADGTFVYLGFRPRFVLVKLSSSSGYDWVLYDSARSPTNVTQNYLNPNTANSENAGGTVADIDFLSNGFKLRNNSTSAQGTNIGNQTYIYAAFAESPFKYANAR